MRSDAVIAGDKLGCGITKRLCRAAERNVIFDNRGLAVLAHDDQVARMSYNGRIVRGRNKEQVDRRLEHDALRNIDVRAIFNERSVQSRERITLDIEIASKMRFNRAGIACKLFREAAHANGFGQILYGKRHAKSAVD